MPTVRSPEYVPTGGGKNVSIISVFPITRPNTLVADHIEEEFQLSQLSEEIDCCISGLSEQCRRVFLLSRTTGLKNREIAERLHISLQAVEKHIQKALRIFSEMLGRENSLYTILILLWMMNANR